MILKQCYFNESQIKTIKKYANKHDLSFSAAVRVLIEQGLIKESKGDIKTR